MYPRPVNAPSSAPSRPTSSTGTHAARWALLAVLLLVVAVVVVARAVGGEDAAPGGASPSGTTSASPAPSDTAAPADAEAPEIARRDPQDTMAIGDVDAPVVVVEWADTRCPFCALFATSTLPVLLEEYVDTGLVRFEFRDVSYFGEQSTDGAVAVRAAAEQGRFEEYLSTLFAAAPDKGHPDLPRETLLGFARDAGVPDLERFEADLDRQDLRAAVEASTVEAQMLGVSGVPFFVVGDQAMSGAQPLEVFRQVLDDAIAAAQP